MDGSRDDQMVRANTGVIPPWQTLPYHILLEVLRYAAPLPTWNPATDVSKPAKWLLAVSRLSRNFFEPGMTAFYYAPPVDSMSKLVGLLGLLQRDPTELMTNYRNKIKSLTINSGIPQARYNDVFSLVELACQLKHIRIYDPTEYGQTKKVFPNSSLDELLSVLDKQECHLHSWEWNKRQIANNIRAVHLRPAFGSLHSLRLYNLDFEPSSAHNRVRSVSDQGGEYSLSEDLTFALAALPDLRQLEFQNCYIPGIAFLLCLPSNLKAISFVDCHKLVSADVERFLATHGQRLTELVLAHNRDLDMSFTGQLGTSCPMLEVFKMDFNFTSPTSSYYDVEPHFYELLGDSVVPSWPTSLQTLQLERLRKWKVEAAERVFDSLVESAPRLVNLRTLIITAILKIEWRDRARFRGHWMQKLERTFLRKSAPPNPNRRSLRTDFETSQPFSGPVLEPTTSPGVFKPAFATVGMRYSLRLAGKECTRAEEDVSPGSTPSKSTAQGATSEDELTSPDEPIHGMCDTVEIRIDNLRPADYLFTAENFQDEEISGDEDWTGQDMEFDEDYAW